MKFEDMEIGKLYDAVRIIYSNFQGKDEPFPIEFVRISDGLYCRFKNAEDGHRLHKRPKEFLNDESIRFNVGDQRDR